MCMISIEKRERNLKERKAWKVFHRLTGGELQNIWYFGSPVIVGTWRSAAPPHTDITGDSRIYKPYFHTLATRAGAEAYSESQPGSVIREVRIRGHAYFGRQFVIRHPAIRYPASKRYRYYKGWTAKEMMILPCGAPSTVKKSKTSKSSSAKRRRAAR